MLIKSYENRHQNNIRAAGLGAISRQAKGDNGHGGWRRV